ncbi:hypothetical protein C8J57DRAFT_1225860 [Mycena rebaudengoi]|nr:hypothetical protein C8J57DRAFT_1225860 [Mycena rebaudengoi]
MALKPSGLKSIEIEGRRLEQENNCLAVVLFVDAGQVGPCCANALSIHNLMKMQLVPPYIRTSPLMVIFQLASVSYVFLVDRNLTLPSNLRRALNWSPASFFYSVCHPSPVSRLIVVPRRTVHLRPRRVSAVWDPSTHQAHENGTPHRFEATDRLIRTHSPRPRVPGLSRTPSSPPALPHPAYASRIASSFVPPTYPSAATVCASSAPPTTVTPLTHSRHAVCRAVRAYDRPAVRAGVTPHVHTYATPSAPAAEHDSSLMCCGRFFSRSARAARWVSVRQEMGMGISMVGSGGSAGMVALRGVVDDVLRYAAEDEPLRTAGVFSGGMRVFVVRRDGMGVWGAQAEQLYGGHGDVQIMGPGCGTRRGWAAAAAAAGRRGGGGAGIPWFRDAAAAASIAAAGGGRYAACAVRNPVRPARCQRRRAVFPGCRADGHTGRAGVGPGAVAEAGDARIIENAKYYKAFILRKTFF